MGTTANLRKALALALLLVLGGGVCATFWYQEYVYSLPTPVPAGYKPVLPMQHVGFYASEKTSRVLKTREVLRGEKPLFLHFFNPECPCSRFNLQHFKTLASQYAGKASFQVIVKTDDPAMTAESISEKFGLSVPVRIDLGDKIAESCGVYATPQAVIIDREGKLFYRGNYNKARYCTDKHTSYARMALDSLLGGIRPPQFGALATRAYGCALPSACKIK